MNRQSPAERIKKFQEQLTQYAAEAAANPADWDIDLDGFPWTVQGGYYDGPHAQFYDRHGKPKLSLPIYDADVAIPLLRAINALAERNPEPADPASPQE